MSDIPSELRYTKTHEWVRVMEDGHFEVGITDHAQQMMGDMVYVELPEVGTTVSSGDEIAELSRTGGAMVTFADEQTNQSASNALSIQR